MLEGKKIIVTGCGRGMGKATFLAYVRAGAKVVGMDIDRETGQQAADAACALAGCRNLYPSRRCRCRLG